MESREDAAKPRWRHHTARLGCKTMRCDGTQVGICKAITAKVGPIAMSARRVLCDVDSAAAAECSKVSQVCRQAELSFVRECRVNNYTFIVRKIQ